MSGFDRQKFGFDDDDTVTDLERENDQLKADNLKLETQVALLTAELAAANETIRRNERSAAYQYEQYNLMRAELEAARKWAAAWKQAAKVGRCNRRSPENYYWKLNRNIFEGRK